MYDPKTKTVVIATSGKYGHGSFNFVLHETGHAIDAAHGRLSSQAAFKAAYAPTATTYSPTQGYYTRAGNITGYLSEAFAESFAGHFGAAKAGAAPTPNWNLGPGAVDLNVGRPSLSDYWNKMKW